MTEEDIQENDEELKEIKNMDLNLDKNDVSMTLKKPNQVYFELYKDLDIYLCLFM